ncbi:hypothetical protein [Spiroplasma phoeniceum]|uniref:Uncharacterized protein n=1 Tax=Spiroplasma phoeniceum P40 TaxID=1276259 RepID=A0A345DLT0_9MOLU|nr:hypothetical protein [Spiroplasma phoeniceum]AXF95168.1 hypothetical protein SDAV_00173 [Spiroplasma phoeniceum P40]
MENNKKVIDYWDDYDPNEFDPAKRPTSILQDKTILNNNQNSVDKIIRLTNEFETYSYYNNKFNVKQNNVQNDVFDHNDNYDKLDYSEFQPIEGAEIKQVTELTDLDELNLNNKNQFVPFNENDMVTPALDFNQIYDLWQKSKANLITRKLDVLRNRVQEQRIEGRRKYSFYAPKSLEELLNKPAQVVLDATPCVGGDEVYPDQKYFNNTVLLSKVQGKNNDNLYLSNSNDGIPLISDEILDNEPLTMSNILKNAKINIDASKKEAIFIKDEDVLDPNNLNYEQRLRLLKLAADTNNEERKKLLQIKLNNGSLLSLSAIVKERLQKVKTGEIELIEETTLTKDNN